jgi:AcrR family transcriptional regulator
MDSSSTPNPDSADGAAPPRPYAVRSDAERLMEAIVRVCARKGYGAASVADVAAAAGLEEADFLRHFSSKEECFLAAYDAISDVVVAHVTGAYERAAGRPWPDRVAAGLRTLLELLAAESEIARVAMIEVTSFGEDARIRYRRALDRFVPFLEEGRGYSAQGSDLPAETAQFAIGGATAMIFDEIRAGRGPELPSILPELTFAVLMPYLGAEGAEEEMGRVAEE